MSWGGRRGSGRLGAVIAGALAVAIPFGGASSALATTPPGSAHDVVVAGPDAVAAVRDVGGEQIRAAGGSLALARLTTAQSRALAARGLAVAKDTEVRLTADGTADGDNNNDRSSTRDVAARDRRGTGAGVTVAVLDSGVTEVPALAGRVVQGADFTGEGMADHYGHGTFDAGLIAGDGTGADGEDTGIVGVAPNARILSVKVADAQGRSTIGKLAMGIAWVLKNQRTYDVSVMSLSLSTSRATSYHLNPVNALVEAAWFSGITVVASAGNEGASAVRTAPGNDPFVITVGSIWDRGTVSRKDDVKSPYSNEGRTLDGFLKPEVTAPGQHMQSTLPAGTTLDGKQKRRDLPAGYGQLSGTSMATAVAAGEVAVLLGDRPSLDPDQVKGLFISTRDRRTDQIRLERAKGRAPRANYGLRPSVALAAAYAQLFLNTTDYASVDWKAVNWRGVAWGNATWTNATWTSATWVDATWASASWTESTWTDAESATWTDSTWTDANTATWTDSTWTDSTWTDSTWTDSTWTDASWSS